MPLTLTEADGLLKEFYVDVAGGPAEQLHNSSPFLAQLEATADNTNAESDEAVWAIHTGRNWGVASIADGGILPTAGRQQDLKARQGLKTHVIRIALTKQVMRAARSTRGAFEKAISREMKLGVKDLRRQIARQVQGTADGVIATCGTTTASTTIVLAAATTLVQMRQFEVGMRVDVGTLASPASIASSREIISIDRAARTITVTGATFTTSSANFVFLAGSGGGPGAGQLEMTGLQHTVSATTTLYGINPATVPVHAAVVDAPATARPATLQSFEKGLGDVYLESGYEGKRLALTTPGLMIAFSANLQSQRRYPGEKSDLKGGYSGLEVYTTHGSAIFTDDKDVPSGNAYLLALDEWLINEWQPAGWEDEDGSILHLVSGTLSYEAVYSWMIDIATTQRNANWRGTNFIEP